MVEVPGLTERGETILKQLDALPQAEKARFLVELSGTPEGRQALHEVKSIVHTLEQRFGHSDPREITKEIGRLGLSDKAMIERIKDVARISDRANRAELSRLYELTRGLKKGLGLGI
ncbi:hypothetical protein BTE77_34515 [Ensifer adhaerens]|nr:hypothetical protein BTE77_34515 [Ensifer adhaerens]